MTSPLPESPLLGPTVTNQLRRADMAIVPKRPLRAYEALRCARQIGFRLLGVPQNNPSAMASADRLRAGDWVGERIKEAAIRLLGALGEVPFDLAGEGCDMAGRVDAWSPDDALVVEGKSVTVKAFEWATGQYMSSRDKAGPKVEHIVQPALGAVALEAEAVHVVYQAVDPDTFVPVGQPAEWTVVMDEVLPHVDVSPVTLVRGPVSALSLAREEMVRQQFLLGLTGEGVLPDRVVPGTGVVSEPSDDVFACKVCAWRPACVQAGAGEVLWSVNKGEEDAVQE